MPPRPRSQDAAAEIEQAKTALEKLTQLSKAEADLAKAAAGGVPVPALSPIGTGTPGEASDPDAGAEVADTTTGVDAAASPDGDQPAGQPSTVTAGIAASPLEEPAGGPREEAVAILNEAATASDVSYAIYLSTLWSIDEARLYWQAMQTAMPDVFGGKTMQLEEVAAGGGADPFYRVLSTPFTSDPEAQAACDRIKSKLRTHDCSVVVQDVTAGG